MVIKPMETLEEIEGKASVHYRAWQEAYPGIVDQSFLDGRTEEMSRQQAQRAFENGISTIIAKDGEEVVGFADYGRYRGNDLEDAGEVFAIYVLKAYYGRGAGHALMQRALEAMKDCKQIAVWVLTGNERAIQFYERCGYRFDGQQQTMILGTPVTEARMVLNR